MDQLLFYNGTIRTMSEDSKTPPEAVLVKKGIITHVGKQKQLEKAAGKEVKKINLKGRALIPGFCDDVLYLWKLGQLKTNMLDLRGVSSIKKLQKKMKTYSKRLKKGDWLIARGFNEVELEEKRIPDRLELDWVVEDRPVILFRTCGHIAVLNTRGLQYCQITKDMRAPKGGTIGKDSDGIPNGIFYESAINLVDEYLPPPSIDQYGRMIHEGWVEAISKGITSATDSGVSPTVVNSYMVTIGRSNARIRMNVIENGNTELRAKHTFSTDILDNELLKINSYKFYLDGHISGKTAAISDRYIDSDDKGITLIDEDTFYELIYPMYTNDMRMSIHAAGDVAISIALNTFERLQKVHKTTIRHRLENLALLTKDHIKQLKKLNVDVIMNPGFIHDFGPSYRKYLPAKFINSMVPLRTLIDNKIEFSLSSGGPSVKDINPFVGIKAAVIRKDIDEQLIGAKEAISVEEAMSSYIKSGAKVNGQEHKKGSIEKGKWADLVILNKDPFNTPAEDLDKILVDQTFVGGNLSFSREGY
ncbi:MAG: amidohydrolase [Bacteroidetes bacterium]|nr:amidohydrolase [Bacteroidota bacterium]